MEETNGVKTGEDALLGQQHAAAEATTPTTTTTPTRVSEEPAGALLAKNETETEPKSKAADNSSRTLLSNWSDGFTYLRRRRDDGKDVELPPSVFPPFLKQVTVNFIDPTTTSVAQQTTMMQQPQPSESNHRQPQQQQQQQPLYETFASIFQRDYQSTLQYVPYRLFRNSAGGVIDRLRVRTVVARSHGGVLDVPEPDGGGSGSGGSSWEQPYCHVYLAACESLEHYRTKVKPSIQVFVSQLEAAAAASNKQATPAATSTFGSVLRRRGSGSSDGSNGDDDNNKNNNTIPPGSPPGNLKKTKASYPSSGSGGSGSRSSSSSGSSPRYVIVYVPTGDRSRAAADDPAAAASPKKAGGAAVGLAGRLAAARQRMAAVRGGGTAAADNFPALEQSSGHAAANSGGSRHSNPNHSKHDDSTSNDGNEPDPASSSSSSSPSMIQKLSKVEREILRRFANDFPNGNVCSLSTLAEQANKAAVDTAATNATTTDNKTGNDEDDDNDNDNNLDGSTHSHSNDFTKLEWSAVLKAMGAACAAGFGDRCQRCDDQLRQLQQAMKAGSFQLDHFWLLKESLAFTYEQMRLPGEALLQYEELRAFLPDPEEVPPVRRVSSRELDGKNTTANGSSSVLGDSKSSIRYYGDDDDDESDEELREVAVTGQALAFRRLLQSHGEYAAVAHVAEDYLLARELALLFQMHKSVRVVQRCLSFVRTAFAHRRARIAKLQEEDFFNNRDGSDEARRRKRQLLELEKWAFDFCWDFKRASDCYRNLVASMKSGNRSGGIIKRSASIASRVTAVDIAFARILCELLEFARVRLVQLGDSQVPNHTLQSASGGLNIRAIQGKWPLWKEPSPQEEGCLPAFDSSKMAFLESALSSPDAFLWRYLDLTKVIVDCNEFCGRKRLASHLRIQRMELLASRGDQAQAAKEILSFVGIYQEDSWSACRFALLFRLASFQRQVGRATDYLQTLVQCFSGPLSTVAPAKAMEALHADLEAVLASKSVEGTRFATASLFFPLFGLEGIAAPQALGSDRNLLKRLYTVGDTVRVTFALESFLPKSITADQIAVNLVPFRVYVAAMEDNHPVDEKDVFRVLTINAAAINRGKNEFTLDWVPKNAGQYIIASAVVSWSGAAFVYTAKELRRPTIRVDVVPCEATQKLTVKPEYLLPGQEQLVTFEFSAGTDVVKEGTLQVVASPGILILPPSYEKQKDLGASEPWTSSFDVPLPPCPPSETVELKSWVKVALAQKSVTSIQPLRVKVTTTYAYGSEDSDGKEESQTDSMETSLDAQIPSLGKPALSVVDGSFMAYSAFNALMNVMLKCNTPAPLTIKGWQLELPPNVDLSDGGDLNESLANEQVSNGEHISLSFDCSFSDGASAPETKQDDPVLHVDFVTEDGETFRESLKLRIGRSAFPTAKPPEMQPVNVKVSADLVEGLVGSPIDITYAIDRAELASLPGKVNYKIDVDDNSWILSGKIEGPVNTMENEPVAVVAIPLRCGRITKFPRISLSFQTETGSSALPVDMGAHPVFTSQSLPNHVSVAFPSGSGSRRLSSKMST